MFSAGALLLLLAAPCAAFDDRPELAPYAKIDIPAARESSALLKSRNFHGVYWTLNDSRNGAVLFALDRDGRAVRPSGAEGDYRGVAVTGAENRDWEAIASDDKGNLYIADAGNNANKRRDLAVYIVPEPDPRVSTFTAPAAKIAFRYPDQDGFPPRLKDFDSEALFWAGGRLYLLTKHRSDTLTKLYRFESLEPGPERPLKLVGAFDAKQMVTDAAVTPDGKRLAVLTYDGLWLLDKPAKSDNYFAGKRARFKFGAGQCEGVTFDGADALLLSNEDRELFEVKLSSFAAY